MNKTITLIIGLLAAANVIYSFFRDSETATIFGYEINIWLYRLIWSFMAVVILYSYNKKRKLNK